MFLRKIIIIIFLVVFLNGCAQNAALLGPAYTLATSGNIYHAGFTYGGNEIVTKTTGKSMVQNIKESITPKKEDSDFQKLVKRNIEKTRKKLNFSNQ
jgi:hypothetical protein